jgi:hypothetical protein
MVRFFGAAVLAVMVASPASAEGYLWVGADHACIVDSATGLRPGEKDIRKDAFDWTSAPKSFRLQVRRCGDVEGTWARCDKAEELVIRTPNFRGADHIGWRSSSIRAFNSLNSLETIGLESDGRFNYAVLGSAVDDGYAAWFTMTGTCTPFE